MKLNLGSEDTKLNGWTNVDINPYVKPDILAPVEDLPLEDNTVDAIYASHVLEHVEFGIDVLKEWHRVLKPGGEAFIYVPDVLSIMMLTQNGIITNRYMHASIYGAHLIGKNKKYHTHHRVYMATTLMGEMEEYFSKVQLNPEDMPRKKEWIELVVKGIK